MEMISYAIELETVIRDSYKDFEKFSELKEIINLLSKFENNIIALLKNVQTVNDNTYPIIDVRDYSWIDNDFKKALNQFAYKDNADRLLVALWMIYAAAERSAQFYQQAVLNSAHPVSKMFFTSLYELKSMIRRRLDGVIRILHNEAWAKVGFATFTLSKE